MHTACDSAGSSKTMHIDVLRDPVADEIPPTAEAKMSISKNCQRYSCDYVVNCTILPSNRTQWASSTIQQHGSYCIDQSHKSDSFALTKPPIPETKVSSIQVANGSSKLCLSRPHSASSAGYVMAEESMSQNSKHKSTTKASCTVATVPSASSSNTVTKMVKTTDNTSDVGNLKDAKANDIGHCISSSVCKIEDNIASNDGTKEESQNCQDPAIKDKCLGSQKIQQTELVRENVTGKSTMPSDIVSLVSSSSSTRSADAVSLSSDSKSTTYYQLVDDGPSPPSTSSSSTICLSSLSSSSTTGTSSLFGRSATNYEEFFAKLGLSGYENLHAKKDDKMESGDTVDCSKLLQAAQTVDEVNLSHVVGGGFIESDFDKRSLSTIFSTEEKSAVGGAGIDRNLSNSTMTLHSAKDLASAKIGSTEKLIEAAIKNADTVVNKATKKNSSIIYDPESDQKNTISKVGQDKAANVEFKRCPRRQTSYSSRRTAAMSAKNSRGDSAGPTKKIEEKVTQKKPVIKIRSGRPPLYQGRCQRVPGIVPFAQSKPKPLIRRPQAISGRRDAAPYVRKSCSVSSVLNAVTAAAGDSSKLNAAASGSVVVVSSNSTFYSREQKFLRATVSEPHLAVGYDSRSQNLDSKIGAAARNKMIVVKMNTAAKLRAKAIKKKYSLH